MKLSHIKEMNEYIKERKKLFTLSDDDILQIRETSDGYLSNKTNEQIRKMWCDYTRIIHPTSYDNPLTYLMDGIFNESLTMTYPIDTSIKYLKKYFNYDEDDDNIQKIKRDDGTYNIIIYVPIVGDNLEVVKKAMGYCGYHLSTPSENHLEQNKFQWVRFEPTYKPEITKQLRESETKLLHLTPYYNWKKIKHVGFTPKSKNEYFKYPHRVYFIKGSVLEIGGIDEVISIGEQLFNENTSKGNNGKYVLITIDLNKIPKTVKFYTDTNYINGVYVTENISPDTIISSEEINYE